MSGRLQRPMPSEHPDVIAAAANGHDVALFNEDVNYVAVRAYERIDRSGDRGRTFYDEYNTFRSTRPGPDPTEMGQKFDFEDAAEMRARLPQLARLFLGDLVG